MKNPLAHSKNGGCQSWRNSIMVVAKNTEEASIAEFAFGNIARAIKHQNTM